MADSFIAGAQQAGHTVVKYVTADKQIKGCMACDTCFSTGTACSIPDDFNELAPLVEEADMIVFSTPIYWFSFPVQLKAALDKFHSFFIGQKALKIKECVLLACSAIPKEDCFDGLVTTYKHIAGHMGWKDCGTILVPGVLDKIDILKTNGLQRAEEFGKKL